MWSCLRTSARKQSSESVGQIVSEETCSFGVRSGFQTFSKLFPKTFSKLLQRVWKNWLGKKVWKKMVQTHAFNEVNEAPEPIKLVADKVLEVLFHDKLADCNNADVPFPIT